MTLKDFQFHEVSFYEETFVLCLFFLVVAGLIFRALFSSRKWFYCFHGHEQSFDDKRCDGKMLSSWEAIVSGSILCLFVLSIVATSHFNLAGPGPLHFSHIALLSILLALTGIVFFKRLKIIAINTEFKSFGDLAGHYYQSPYLRLIVLLIGILFALSCFGLLFICLKLLLFTHGTDVPLERLHSPFLKEFLSLQFASGPGFTGMTKTNLVLIYCFIALIGIQISPLFTQFIFLVKSKSAIASQLVWGTGFFNGGVMLCFATGLAFFVGDLNSRQLSEMSKGGGNLDFFFQDLPLHFLVLFCLLAVTSFFILGMTLIKIIYSLLIVELIPHKKDTEISNLDQNRFILFVTLAISFMSFAFAFYFPDLLLILIGLSIGFSFQLLPVLIGICYVPTFNGLGVLAGLIVGLAIVLLTQQTSPFFLFDTASFGIHSTVWAGMVNFLTTIFISLITQSRNAFAHRLKFHELYEDQLDPSQKSSLLIHCSWGLLFIWFFFAIGPGAFLGSEIFTSANDAEDSLFVLPSILIWHFIWWVVGVFLIWLLAYPLRFNKDH